MRARSWWLGGALLSGACLASGGGSGPVEGDAERAVVSFVGYAGPLRPLVAGAGLVARDLALSPVVGEYAPRVLFKVATSTTPCPVPNAGWAVRPLFASAALPTVPPGLARYCLFEWVGTGAPVLPATGQTMLDQEPDHMAVTPQTAPSLVEITQEGFAAETAFALRTAPLHSADPAPLPRLALLDTSPSSDLTPGGQAWMQVGRNDHGYTLANLLREMTIVEVEAVEPLLPDPVFAPAVELRSRLAMDLYVATDGSVLRDPVGGGDFGTIALLAEAIHAEVEAWVADGRPGPLIVNLSLGWNPIWGGDDPSPAAWPLDVQAAYDAIYEASCRGALVVAAAGNRSGGPSGAVGPVYPAAWETRLLSDAQCLAIAGGVLSDYTAVDDRPVVYAVGAVDEHLVDLAISRVGSRPPRVAFGDHATGVDHLGAPMSILTGTSVSAAVVSAAAALVWHNLPSLQGWQVMQSLDGVSPTAGPVAPAFCPGGSCGAAAVVNLCNALRQACEVDRPAGSCARVISPVDCAEPPVDGSPDPAEAALFASSTPTVALSFPYLPRAAVACGAGTIDLYHDEPWRAEDPCPDLQFYEFVVEPWTEPQPTHDICPPCYIEAATGVVYLEWEGRLGTMDSLTLTLQSTGGALRSFTTSKVPPADALTYTLSPALLVGVEKAWVTGVTAETAYTAGVELR